jgi:hypothetical protein
MRMRTARFLRRVFLAVTVLCSLSTLPLATLGQATGLPSAGAPGDWSHHHLVFSSPGTADDAAKQGKLERWTRITNNPRYKFQQWKRTRGGTGKRSGQGKDWSMNLGAALSLLPNQYPAKFSFSTTTASCNDFVVYPTGVASAAATVIAFNNMYGSATCPSAPAIGPSTYWAYNTGGTAVLSPVLSIDGTQIAYIQTISNMASLVLLKWAASGGTANSPASITLETNSGYRNCTAPCYTTIALNGNPNDLNSAPFPDYDSDTLYAGDNSGHLHKFSGVFSGNPMEVTSASWPIAVSANLLTSPVYDSGSGNIFVADSGGYLYGFNASSAAEGMRSSQLTSASSSVGIVDSPLVDSTAGEVYVFVGDDANTSTGAGAGCQNATGCSGVFQFSSGNTTVATAGTTCVAASAAAWTTPAGDTINCGVESVFGSGTSTTPAIYDGAFDAIYLTGAGTAGNLWTCASSGAEPRLSYTPFEANGSIVPVGDVIGSATTVIGSLTTAAAACSPVTEFYGSNGGANDYVFASVTAHGNAGAGCSGSCLYIFIVSTDGVTESTPSAAAASAAAAGGTGGIIVDNDLPTANGESQIYYTTLSTQSCANNGVATTGNCAVQASPVTLTATTTSLAEGFVGTGYSVQLASIGGVSPITWTLTSGTLPAGLSLSSNGLIQGTPTGAVSATPLVFRVTDIESNTSSTGTLDLTIAATAFSVSASSCTLTGTQYMTYAGCTIATAGGTPPYAYSFDTSPSPGYAPVPPGLSLNPSTGAITGTNYGQGAYTTHFIATDSLGAITTVDVPFSLAGNNTVGFPLFPTDSAFHIQVTNLPVDTSIVAQTTEFANATIKPFFGALPNVYQPNGIPFLVVPYNQSTLPVTTTAYQAYFGAIDSATDPDTCVSPCPATAPIPSYAPIEGYAASGLLQDGDMHVLIVQQPGGGNPASLWEMWVGAYSGGSSPSWSDGSNARWANIGNTGAGAYVMLPQGVGSSDAAGLPVAPLLLTADEVIGTGTPAAPNGVVQHPVRFTLDSTLGTYVWPATAQAGAGYCVGGYEDQHALISQLAPPTSCNFPYNPMGEIYRLKASVPNPACAATSPQTAVIIQGLRDYGMILADNGPAAALIGTPDSRWSDADLACLTSLTFGQFEPVQVQQLAADLSLVESGTGTIVTSCPSGQTCYNMPVTTYRTTTSTGSVIPASGPAKATPVRRKP